MVGNCLAQDSAEIGGEREIAAFVELRRVKARPAPIDAAAAYRAAENKHHVSVSVIGAAIAIFPCCPAKLRHGHDHRVFAERSKVGPERGDGLREVAQHVGELAFGSAFIHVMVPAADVSESDLHAEIGFDQLRRLA